ncbi:MAG: transposase [Planctomycetes bacterium]|nr:transposase [Planctomycetota bacterium]
MERKSQAPTLIDAVIHDIGDPNMTARLDQLDRAVPWAKLAAPIQATYGNATNVGGRPNVPVEMMFKVMMLQKWFNLGDAMAEGMLRDRISFRRFLGMGLSDDVIDEISLVRFRARLRGHGLTAGLFDAVATHLREAGLIVNEGTLVPIGLNIPTKPSCYVTWRGCNVPGIRRGDISIHLRPRFAWFGRRTAGFIRMSTQHSSNVMGGSMAPSAHWVTIPDGVWHGDPCLLLLIQLRLTGSLRRLSRLTLRFCTLGGLTRQAGVTLLQRFHLVQRGLEVVGG